MRSSTKVARIERAEAALERKRENRQKLLQQLREIACFWIPPLGHIWKQPHEDYHWERTCELCGRKEFKANKGLFPWRFDLSFGN